MAVAVDAAGTGASVLFNGVTTFSVAAGSAPITVGASATALALVINFNNSIASTFATSITASWNAVSMTIASNQTFTSGALSEQGTIFGQVSPASGNKAVSCSWTTSMWGYWDLISFTGSSTVSVAAAFINAAGGGASNAGPASVTITSNVGDFVLGIAGTASATWGTISNTTLFTNITGGKGNAASNYATGASPSVTLTAANSFSDVWCYAGIDITVPAGGDVLSPQIWL
jgi:hypothetical protein